MIIVGLTGGIGSGKTSVANIFRELHVPVLDADQIGRDLIKIGQPSYLATIDHFGNSIVNKDQTINRAKLKSIIFESKEERAWLEQLLHPLIISELKKKIASIDSEYVVIEIPLLFEANLEEAIDRILVIDCNEQFQIDRIMKRDGIPKEAVQSIIASQISRTNRLARAHDVINNEGEQSELRKEINDLHQYYRELANRRK